MTDNAANIVWMVSVAMPGCLPTNDEPLLAPTFEAAVELAAVELAYVIEHVEELELDERTADLVPEGMGSADLEAHFAACVRDFRGHGFAMAVDEHHVLTVEPLQRLTPVE